MSPLEPVFRMVVDASWRMSCLILVLLALRSILHHHVSARVLFWVWIAVAIRLLVPFAAPVKWSPFNLTRSTALGTTAISTLEAIQEPGLPVTIEAPPTRSEPIHPSAVLAKVHVGWGPVQWLALTWSMGVAILVVGRFRTYRRFVWRLKRASGTDEDALVSLVVEAAANHRLRGARVVVSDSVNAPALHGIFRPKLLFPPGLVERLTPLEIKLIVAHEMGHCERRDLVAQALIHASQILHWFNPLVWVVARASRQDCELACDEHVLRRLDSFEPQVYGATLVKILGMVGQTPRAPLVLGIVESKQHMKRRIEMIIANNAPSFTRSLLGCALLGLVGALSLTRETLAQQPAAAAAPKVTV